MQPITIARQGSFMAGGRTLIQDGVVDFDRPTASLGQTLHGDHAYVSYQIPENARPLPLVFLHGALSSSVAWKTTPDGREGFDTLFLRKGYGVYLVDQPRRGKAGRSTIAEDISADPDDQLWYHTWRLGRWPALRQGAQFPAGDEVMDQFLRWMTPNTGAYDEAVIAEAMAALFDKTEGILVTHSQGCGPSWQTALRSENVKAIVAFEPGSGFLFPEQEVPAAIETNSPFGPLSATGIPLKEFEKLTRMPIVIYYGDFIAENPSDEWPADHWRGRKEMAQRFVDAINAHGGNASLVSLPAIGIYGNSHFAFVEKNNAEIADAMHQWIDTHVGQKGGQTF